MDEVNLDDLDLDIEVEGEGDGEEIDLFDLGFDIGEFSETEEIDLFDEDGMEFDLEDLIEKDREDEMFQRALQEAMSETEVEAGLLEMATTDYDATSNDMTLLLDKSSGFKRTLRQLINPHADVEVSSNQLVNQAIREIYQDSLRDGGNKTKAIAYQIGKDVSSQIDYKVKKTIEEKFDSGEETALLVKFRTSAKQKMQLPGATAADVLTEVKRDIESLKTDMSGGTQISKELIDALHLLVNTTVEEEEANRRTRDSRLAGAMVVTEKYTEAFEDSVDFVNEVYVKAYAKYVEDLIAFKERVQKVKSLGGDTKMLKPPKDARREVVSLIKSVRRDNDSLAVTCADCGGETKTPSLIYSFKIRNSNNPTVILGIVCSHCGKGLFLAPKEQEYLNTVFEKEYKTTADRNSLITVYTPDWEIYQRALPRAWKDTVGEETIEEESSVFSEVYPAILEYRRIINSLKDDVIPELNVKKYSKFKTQIVDESTGQRKLTFPAFTNFKENDDFDDLVKRLAQYLAVTYMGDYSVYKSRAVDSLGDYLDKDVVLFNKIVPVTEDMEEAIQQLKSFKISTTLQRGDIRYLIEKVGLITGRDMTSCLVDGEDFNQEEYERLVNDFLAEKPVTVEESLKNIKLVEKQLGLVEITHASGKHPRLMLALDDERYAKVIDRITDRMIITSSADAFLADFDGQDSKMLSLEKETIVMKKMVTKNTFTNVLGENEPDARAKKYHSLFNKLHENMALTIFGEAYRQERSTLSPADMVTMVRVPPKEILMFQNTLAWYKGVEDLEPMFALRTAYFNGDQQLVRELEEIVAYVMNEKEYSVTLSNGKKPKVVRTKGFPSGDFKILKAVLETKFPSPQMTEEDLEGVVSSFYHRKFDSHFGENAVREATAGKKLVYVPEFEKEELEGKSLDTILSIHTEKGRVPREYEYMYMLMTGFTTYFNKMYLMSPVTTLVVELIDSLLVWGPFMLNVLSIDSEIFKVMVQDIDMGIKKESKLDSIAKSCMLTLTNDPRLIEILYEFTESWYSGNIAEVETWTEELEPFTDQLIGGVDLDD